MRSFDVFFEMRLYKRFSEMILDAIALIMTSQYWTKYSMEHVYWRCGYHGIESNYIQ